MTAKQKSIALRIAGYAAVGITASMGWFALAGLVLACTLIEEAWWLLDEAGERKSKR